MLRVSPEHTITKLAISLEGESTNSTKAHISHEVTAIGNAGDKFMEEFTESWYEKFMTEWETVMNHYIKTGRLD